MNGVPLGHVFLSRTVHAILGVAINLCQYE